MRNFYGYLLHPSLTPEGGPGATDICLRHTAHGWSEIRLATVRWNLPSWPWNNEVLLGWSQVRLISAVLPTQSASQPAQADRQLVASDGRKLDKGQYFAFHTKGIRCQYGARCKYTHKCKTCGARHPSYEKCGAYLTHHQHTRSGSGAQSHTMWNSWPQHCTWKI